MAAAEDRRYRISEVSAMTQVPVHILRQWESRFPQLRPKRDRANRRYYLANDIDIVRQLKYYLKHEGMTSKGAQLRLKRVLDGEGPPQTRQAMLDLVQKMEQEVQSLLDLLSD